jgi:hypothetical protein
MPNKEFLENYPLYRKFKMDFPDDLSLLPKPAIHMPCLLCGSEQTFNAHNYIGLFQHTNAPVFGHVVHAVYVCTSCRKFMRNFLLKFDLEGKYVIKVGQEPPWDITPDRNLEKILGQHAYFYKKGLICESQGYGIGAFSYYRRIVDEIIDELLSGISDLLSDVELTKYQKALEKTKNTTVTQDKIELVKDLLPPILRPNGINPLDALHTTLSKGLHNHWC